KRLTCQVAFKVIHAIVRWAVRFQMGDMSSIDAFLRQLEQIPWFANLGRLSSRDDEVFRICHWHTWPGPEDPGSSMQAAFHMSWRNSLFEATTDEQASYMKQLEKDIRDITLGITKLRVPYDEDQDVWHGPTAAAWFAAKTAALAGCTLFKYGNLGEKGDRS